VSAGHIYENPETKRLLTSNPELIRTGIVAIGLRNDCRDFADLLDFRELQGKSIAQTDYDLSTFLDRNTAAIIRWTPKQSQSVLRKTLIKRIEDPHTILRRRLRGVKNTSKKMLKAELENLQDHDTTRSNLKNLAEKYIPIRSKAFMREVNLLYYVIGSGKNLKPHLNPQLFSDLNRGYIESAEIPNQAFLFDEIIQESLKEMYVPIELIDQMSILNLASFREKYAMELEKFRRKWWHTFILKEEDKFNNTFALTPLYGPCLN
jgi:hypothetical protein